MGSEQLNERINTLYKFMQDKWQIDDEVISLQEKKLTEVEKETQTSEVLQKLLSHCSSALSYIEGIMPDYNIRAMSVTDINATENPDVFLVKGTDLESEKIKPEFQVSREIFEDYDIKNFLDIKDNFYMVFFLEINEDKSVDSIILLDATDNKEKALMLTMSFLISEFSNPIKQFGNIMN
jgi:hypothetical protein